MWTKRLLTVIGLLAVLALFAAACGDGNAAAEPTSTPIPTPTLGPLPTFPPTPPPPGYTLEVAVSPPDRGGAVALVPEPGPGDIYATGTVVKLTASPADREKCGDDPFWSFERWSGDLQGSTTTAAITMNLNRSVTAHFLEVSPQRCPSRVVLTEWRVRSEGGDTLETLPGGMVELKVHNEGGAEHRLSIWRDGEVQGDRVEGGTLIAETDFIGPGDVAALEINLEPGTYILVCPISGHTLAGMHTNAAVHLE